MRPSWARAASWCRASGCGIFTGPLFKKLGADRTPILIEDGERYKNLNTVARILDALVKAQADRSTVLIAVGGGVIGDMVGFSAATYLRGIPIVHVPTTLLAQVDSAIGGKTGVNHPLGKNLIGSFHAPSLVVADPIVLETLPRREFRAGLYEVIKYGVISDPALLDRMRDSTARRSSIATARRSRRWSSASCRIKAAVVSADERESGLRRILNFGHTVGHALESVTKYKQFRHGEAIGYGMLAALAIGVARGVTPKSLYEEVESLITQLGPLPSVAGHLREGGLRRDRPRQESRRRHAAFRRGVGSRQDRGADGRDRERNQGGRAGRSGCAPSPSPYWRSFAASVLKLICSMSAARPLSPLACLQRQRDLALLRFRRKSRRHVRQRPRPIQHVPRIGRSRPSASSG